MNNKNYRPELKGRLDRYVSKSILASPGNTNKKHETVITCYSYHCPLSRKCNIKTQRPSKVSIRKCLRFHPEETKPFGTLSELALDLLSAAEQRGEKLSKRTKSILDQYRPTGPLRQGL
ncbi:MAG TPA: hypothetical protein QF838_09185 [SAR202 cluster bacterium]|nr:hypothetical protein [SAR202 cluster bacterium]